MWYFIGQAISWLVQNPQVGMVIVKLAQEGGRRYNKLSPEQKERVDNIIQQGIQACAKRVLSDVMGDVAEKVMRQVGSQDVAEFAKAAVRFGVNNGYNLLGAPVQKISPGPRKPNALDSDSDFDASDSDFDESDSESDASIFEDDSDLEDDSDSDDSDFDSDSD